ncbi:MAG: hypothetical protein C0602_00405 [Denitrovibrio sp.]|nr:MAG: hypothetical protein C0602_00405 [Denitrovibrio sp.]
MKTLVIIFSFLIAVSSYAFPMRGLEKGALIDLQKFSTKNGSALKDNSALKMLIVWSSDKRLSKKQYEVYSEFCTEEKVACFAVDRNGDFHDDTDVVSAVDKNGYTETWGLITIPVTIILNKDNKIIDAVGYEGQYKHKMREVINNLKKQ